ncbi:IS110 family transposase [Sciscionella sediminilitoris]|uniref:IS110 family transposase n=1 Tax=Sciscionella sediminilitoris TaxID=1445613 RepID=UPI001E604E00|nr:IS110 family transposase [Sciscionella sp. SE31]
MTRLVRHGHPAELPVKTETTCGLVVDRLLPARNRVVPVHPNAFRAARLSRGVASAKAGPGNSGELAAMLDTHRPGGKTILTKSHSGIALTFLDRYPNPESAVTLAPAETEAFCRRHRYGGRRSGTELLTRLSLAPVTASRPGRPVITGLLRPQIALVHSIRAGINQVAAAIAETVARHPYTPLLTVVPRVGLLNLAEIIGEVGPVLERATSFEQLATETGTAAVSRASGRTHTVAFRHATTSRRYTAARQRGQRHPHAVRPFGRA